MTRHLTTCLSVLFAIQAASAFAGNAERGEIISRQGNDKGAPACISCHGERGQGNAEMEHPYLAGLPGNYIMRQLLAFKSGQRSNAVMQPIAATLEEADIKAIAAYFSQLQPPAEALSKPSTAAQQTLGEDIARNGRWKNGVPACFQCHGDAGQGVGTDFPPISGQPAEYLKQQLAAWAKGTRTGDPVGLMQSVVSGLSDGERTAVARYLASLPPPLSAAGSSQPSKQD